MQFVVTLGLLMIIKQNKKKRKKEKKKGGGEAMTRLPARHNRSPPFFLFFDVRKKSVGTERFHYIRIPFPPHFFSSPFKGRVDSRVTRYPPRVIVGGCWKLNLWKLMD